LDEFISIELSSDSLDKYYIRTSIFDALKRSLGEFKGSFLDIGCGKMPYKEFILQNSNVERYIGLDIYNAIQYDQNVQADFTWNGVKMPFEDSSFESSFGTEVLEHCPYPKITLDEVNRVLKPGGVFFFTVPFLWNLHEQPMINTDMPLAPWRGY
jgi:SAM-dependent methyltransferase